MPAAVKDTLFDYAVSTFDRGRYGGSVADLFGNGFGLPTTRVYARHFGGEIDLQSIAGYGTTALLKLRPLSAHPPAPAGARRAAPEPPGE